MTTKPKKNPAKLPSQPTAVAPNRKAGGKAATPDPRASVASKKQPTAKSAVSAASKKASAAKPTGFEGLSIQEMCTRIEKAVRDLAVAEGNEAAAYRKHLSNVFYFSYELAQKALGSSDDLHDGQAQVSDELDNSPFVDLVDRVSEALNMDDAENLRIAARREEVRLAFLLK